MKRLEQKVLLPLLTERYPDIAREELYSLVMCGEIRINGERIRNPKQRVAKNASIQIQRSRFVGRGGEKLNAILDDLNDTDFNPRGQVCLDAGASTGGFTDCLLQRGARLVHAVDVGYNQLAWKLRCDARVMVHEKTNIMGLKPGQLQPEPQMAVADLSFRSLRGAASQLLALTANGPVLVLVKPQFENPPEADFDGVVRSDETRRTVLDTLCRDFLRQGIHVNDVAVSPLKGRKGNIEIFLLLSYSEVSDGDYVRRRWDAALNPSESL